LATIYQLVSQACERMIQSEYNQPSSRVFSRLSSSGEQNQRVGSMKPRWPRELLHPALCWAPRTANVPVQALRATQSYWVALNG